MEDRSRIHMADWDSVRLVWQHIFQSLTEASISCVTSAFAQPDRRSRRVRDMKNLRAAYFTLANVVRFRKLRFA